MEKFIIKKIEADFDERWLRVKKIIQNNDISKNEIISKEHNKSNGTQFFTEEKVMKGYRKILSELN